MLGKNAKDQSDTAAPVTNQNAVPSHSVVGKGMSISGDCVTEGHVRVEGTVVGTLRANGIELTDGAVVDGDLAVPDTSKKGQVFVVAGHVTGRVRAHIVDVKKTGVVLGGIEAEEATIHGTVKGGVTVRHRLAVASTAVLDGDVSTDRLVMDEGGRVNGTIRMGREAVAPEREKTSSDRSDATSGPTPAADATDVSESSDGRDTATDAGTKRKPAAA